MVSEPDSAAPGTAGEAPGAGSRRWLRDPRLPTLVVGLALCALVIAVRWYWNQLTEAHVPYVDYDTQIFEQIAAQPASVALLFAPKPLIVPLVYRLASDHAALVGVQECLAFVSWAALAASLALALRRRWTRALAVVVGVAFLLAPARVGFTGSLLSESINDSLTTLVVAGAVSLIWLRGRARRVAVIATALLGLAWLLTRDTNAVIAIVAAASAMLIWRGWRQRWAWGAALLAVAGAAFVLWTASVPHAPLAYQSNWYERFTPRAVYPMVDNLAMRVYREQPEALPSSLRAFAAEGTPWLNVEQIVRAGPGHRADQDWLVDHGSSTYARWLLGHPVDRIAELIGARWMILAGGKTVYMPKHWVSRGGLVRSLTQKHAVLLVLLLAAPLLLWRPRADPLRGLALCLIASGAIGAAAAYYGDGAEVARHCYGAGQQVVLGLFVALLAWLDRARAPSRSSDPVS